MKSSGSLTVTINSSVGCTPMTLKWAPRLLVPWRVRSVSAISSMLRARDVMVWFVPTPVKQRLSCWTRIPIYSTRSPTRTWHLQYYMGPTRFVWCEGGVRPRRSVGLRVDPETPHLEGHQSPLLPVSQSNANSKYGETRRHGPSSSYRCVVAGLLQLCASWSTTVHIYNVDVAASTDCHPMMFSTRWCSLCLYVTRVD